MRRSLVETLIGAVVLFVAGFFLYFTYTTGYQRVDGYEVTAKFNSVAGLTLGSDVRMSGIKVGSVVGARLDPDSYLAVLRLRIEKTIKLPVDTTAKITSDSLLGSNYVSLEPGAETKLIPENGQIQVTQDPINVVDLIGRFIFGSTTSPKQPGSKQDQQPQSQTQPQPKQTQGGTGTTSSP
jgi:phospholipid/cholesterol/gamma-HCH transport system substrate-binding protein